MKAIKLALPLLAATIMAGCGSDTIIKPSDEKHLDDTQMLIIEKSENSIYNPLTQNKLVVNIFNYDRITGVMLDNSGTNKRPELIAAIEKRTAVGRSLICAQPQVWCSGRIRLQHSDLVPSTAL